MDYDDPIKRIWREKWLDFQRSTLRKFVKSPSECRVICMPSEEGFEIDDVYRVSGFPLENITAVEIVPTKAEKLRKRYPSATVIEGNVKDILRTIDGRFWSINLDYTSPFTSEVRTAMEYIAGRQLLEPRGIFGVTVLGKRERAEDREMQQYEAMISQVIKHRRIEDEKPSELSFFRRAREAGISPMHDIYQSDLRRVRSDALVTAVLSSFIAGTRWVTPNSLFSRCPKKGDVEFDYFRDNEMSKLFFSLLEHGDNEEAVSEEEVDREFDKFKRRMEVEKG